MNITINHIKHYAKYNTILLVKGSAIYRQGRIQQVDIDIDDNDVIVIQATTNEFENKNHPNVQLFDGEIVGKSCDCKEMVEHGACRHTIGLLYLYMYELYQNDVKHLMEKGSDPIALAMIDTYLKRKVIREVSEQSVRGVQLRPTLHINEKKQVSVSFEIGTDKFYLIKDIDSFLGNLEENQIATYGKHLSFKHTIDSFDELSRVMIQFLKRKAREMSLLSDEIAFNNSYRIRRNLTLAPTAIDEFIKVNESRMLSLEFSETVSDAYVVYENPGIQISIVEKNQDQYVIRLLTPYQLFHGENCLYLYRNAALYCCEESFSHDMKDFLMILSDHDFTIVIHKQHMNAFYNSVLAAIEQYVEIRTEVDLTAYEPVSMTSRIYFDMYDANKVKASLKFVYEGQEYSLGAQDANYHQNIAEEQKMIHLISKYFPEQAADGFFYQTHESELYELVSRGFDELSQYSELFYSADFKNIQLRNTPAISAGVRLSEGLLHLNFDFDNFDVHELKQLLQAYRQNKKYYRCKDGSFMQLEEGSFNALSDMMEGFHLTEKDILKGELAIPKYRAMQMDYFIKQNDAMKFERDRAFKQLIRDFTSVSDSDFEVDKELRPILRNYQKSGYRWLKTMTAYQFGGILADDMGLGKTLQVIALLKSAVKEYEKKQEGAKPISIVICPASLVLNWESEIAKFAPELKALVVMGSAKARSELISQALDYDVIVTSYDLLKRDVEFYQEIEFQFEIIDEAQYIKNHNTQAAKSVKEIRSRQRFALSGTPVENSLAELWSLFDYLMPNYLYTYHYFKTHYETPIVRDNDRNAIAKLKSLVQPFILRRLKKDVLKELPDKIETTMYCQLEGNQQKLYVANAMEMSRELRQRFQMDGIAQSRFMVLSLLTKLRQICCHPRLCYDTFEGDSSKLEMCMELIHNSVDGNHKVLVFSSFTSMLALVKEKLDAENIPYFELTGATSKHKRMEMVNQFQEGKVPIFLISLKAGGTGLNLTAADVVIHFDPWWNSSAQNQATDRTHRIGQMNNVNVYNLIAKDTIEEKILKLQEMKSNLADAIVEEGGNLISQMSKEDILALFEV